jgi:hypothetical protein
MRFRVVAVSGKALFCLACIGMFPALVAAQSETPAPVAAPPAVAVAPGDAAISGFSGVGLIDGTLPPGVNPLDKTFITLANPSLKVLDLANIGGAAAGQLLPPSVKFLVPAKDIGQVFALAFDDGTDGGAPNVYAASTSIYGFSIVGGQPGPDGKPLRLKAGAPGARFMEGQFGPGASPGAIWKIDGTTGRASLFAETVDGAASNSGPAVGDIAIDLKSNSLFASDLDTGLIHRFPLNGGGTDRGVFDHGTTGRTAAQLPAVADDKKRADITSAAFKPEDPQTWGFTQPERRIDGLAVRDGRLYYAVAAGAEIWSVGIAADGSFASDARREVEVAVDKSWLASDIAFDADGHMIVALRGALKGAPDYRQFVAPESGAVLRFAKTGDTKSPWASTPAAYAVGATANTATGGVALGYAYGSDGSMDLAKCSATLGATGDALPVAGGGLVNGVQLMDVGLVQPAKAPEKSVFVDFDIMQNDKRLTGHVGDIEIFQRCDGRQFPAVASEPGAVPDSGAGAAPGGFPGGSPNGFAEGIPGEAGVGEDLPADGAPDEDVAEAPVDPNAPNLAITKTKGQCNVAGDQADCTFNIALTNTGTTPFTIGGGAITDTFNGPAPKIEVAAAGGAQILPNGLNVPFPQGTTVQPGQASAGVPVRMSFKVPPGGTTVENCATLSLTAAEAAPAPSPPPPSPRDAPPQFAAVPGMSITRDRWKCVDANPTTGLKRCTTLLDVTNSNDSKTRLRLTIDSPTKIESASVGRNGAPKPIGDNRVFVNSRNVDEKTKIPLAVTLPSDADINAVRVRAGVPLDDAAKAVIPADVVAEAAAFPTAPAPAAPVDSNASDPAPAPAPSANSNADAAPAPVASVDANPADNTSCVAVDTNNLDAPSTPTNEPTLPPGNSGPQACVPPTPTKPLLLNGALVNRVPTCTQFPGGRKECRWVFNMENRSQLINPGFDAKFSVPPSQLRDASLAEFLTFTDPDGQRTDFSMTVNLGSGVLGQEIIGVFPPNQPDPTLDISLPQSTRDAAKAAGPAPGADVQLDFPEDACVTAETETPNAPPPGIAPRLDVVTPAPPAPTAPPDLHVIKMTPGKKDKDDLVTCDVNAPCRFHIAVGNKGATYEGPLTIEDRIAPPPIPKGSTVQPKPQSISIFRGTQKPDGSFEDNGTDPRLKCDPPTDFNVSCKADSIKIEKGEFVNVIVEVVPGFTWKALDNLLDNCAFITFENMPADGSPPQHHSCKPVKLDPFDVKVAKSGGQSCQPGKECKFELDIFNPGNIPHDDPVTVTDKLTGIGDAPILSLTAASGADPFPCTPPPTQAPFTCTGHMRLEVGEHNKYNVVIRIPEDAPTSGAFTNCAGVGRDATGATPGSTDDVCHTTRLEPAAPDTACPDGWTGTYPKCTAPQEVSGGPSSTGQEPLQNALAPTGGMSSTGEPACFGGMILVSGGCRCPAPTILNGSTGMCVAAPECPDGYDGEYPYCRLGPTGGSFATALPESPRDRRTSTPTSRRGGGGSAAKSTGGVSSTADSQSIKDRRTAGEPRPPRRRRDPRPPPTGGMSATGLPVPQRVPDRQRFKPTAGGQGAAAGPKGGMSATGQPNKTWRTKTVGKRTTTQQPAATPKPPIKAVGKRDPRINYGSSVNDKKPNLGGVR